MADCDYIQKNLKHRQASRKGEEKHDVQKAMKEAQRAGIEWGSFPARPQLDSSPWHQTLTIPQRDRLHFALQEHPDPQIFFRDCHPDFGRGCTSTRLGDGRVVINTIMPSQLTFVFDSRTDEDLKQLVNKHPNGDDPATHITKQPHRIVTGREAMHLQGFPVDIIDDLAAQTAEGSISDNLLSELAGNMVSVPVFLAGFAAAMASVPWLDEASPVPGTPKLGVVDDDSQPPVTPGVTRTGGVLQRRYAPYIPLTPPLDGAQTA